MKPKPWELLVVGGLLLALIVWALWPHGAGTMVTVTVDGAEEGTYPLHQDTRAEISGYGGYQLTLVISQGEAQVEEATCPDLICQHHSPISRSGDQIICLPGRVVVEITGEEAEIDAVTQ